MSEETKLLISSIGGWTLAAAMILWMLSGYDPAHSLELVIASTYNDGTVDANGLTAAHKTLPLGTRLTVKHGHRTTVVTINDRGPFVKGRSIDLTPAANKYLRCGGLCRLIIEPWPPLPKPRPFISEAFAWGEE